MPSFRSTWLLAGLLLAAPTGFAAVEPPPLEVSVYATAGDILHHLASPAGRDAAAGRLAELGVSRVFLEGRRGDEYVPPALLAEVRDALQGRGLRTTGGIATVPGGSFGTRQQGPLGWLNWESPRTRADVAGFFRENAPVFGELIVDDFYCTGDTSPESERARGTRSWGDYRRDLMVSLIPPLIVEPSRSARPDVRLILKFPQWYDRFHLFGYDPVRMAEPFDAIWVGTEVRNPLTRRMGYVQPTEGYINFSWIRSAVGPRVKGAWFDHIECSPQNFVDQAYLSVLAGAAELTLFRLGDVLEPHPGGARFAERLPELRTLSGRVRAREEARIGIPFYKPPGSDAGDNLYVMDVLAMMGWPILPAARYPADAPVVVLGAQAAADPGIHGRVAETLRRGGTVCLTPDFLRRAGAGARAWTRFEVAPDPAPAEAARVAAGADTLDLPDPIQIDASLRASDGRVREEAVVELPSGRRVPLLAGHREGRGRVWVLNLRTFSDADFRDTGEWLLAPRALGWSSLPASLTDPLRAAVLRPLGWRFDGPAGVAVHGFKDAVCLYNFRAEPTPVRFGTRRETLAAHACRWIDR